jgi:ABC-type bacteriocin/lantibiotic exporter with double-glycine peptidase domain
VSDRRLLIPEVVQTSAIDCGPACLNALLSGYGRYVSYGRLREACQTSVDGTSIDTIESLASQLGLEAEQIVIPNDHIALPEAAALPAIVIVRLPTGLTHFVVVWRRHGDRLQLMDPAAGRRWTPIEEFANELYAHEMAAPADAWREWAASPDFTSALMARMLSVGVTPQEAAKITSEFSAAPGWRAMATVDAAVRMLQSLARSGAFDQPRWPMRRVRQRIRDAVLPRNTWLSASKPSNRRSEIPHTAPYRMLIATIKRVLESPQEDLRFIPQEYWSVRPGEEKGQLVVHGAVLIRVKGLNHRPVDISALPPEIAAAASESSPQPAKELWRLLKRDGALTPAMVALASVAASVGVVLQAVVFRALAGAAHELSGKGQRIAAVAVVLALLAILLAIDIPTFATLVAMGRRLETRFRTAFLEKLPRIGENYFHGRLTSDMAERNHNVHRIRLLPTLAGQMLTSAFELIFTTAAVIWIDPRVWYVAVLLALTAAGIPLAAQRLLGERQLRVRTHAGALSRFYLDALLGMIPIRTHVADGVVRGEHTSLLAKWTAAGLETQKITIALEGIQMFAGFGLAALLVLSHISRHPDSPAMLLLAYWSLNIPMIGRELGALVCEYPQYRNVVLRLLEPLGALENWDKEKPTEFNVARLGEQEGTAFAMEDVEVMVGGHHVLRNINLQIRAGSHIAIVGPSGAGKSSLVGLALGWRTPTAGALTVDHEPLSRTVLDNLRRQTAWVDPTVQLWNRSLIENLRYGATGDLTRPVGQAVDEAGLTSVLDKLPDGLQTALGDSGALVSGGEGQRVRLCRALLRPGVRLAILDEPFRGLDPKSRKSLLDSVRETWRSATMLFVTHDVADTVSFDRVLVMEEGTIVEDGVPGVLAESPKSRYAQLLRSEIELKHELLHGQEWRRFEMQNGVLSEEALGSNSFPQEGTSASSHAATPARRERIA